METVAAAGARVEAHRSLVRAARGGKYINIELDASLSRLSDSLPPVERALYTALVYGTVERMLTLDGEIAHYTSRGADKFDIETLTSLRLGLYQILFMDKIPPHAAVNETVATAPARSRGLVNAVLRRCLREGARLHPPRVSDELSPEYLSYVHSIPRAIVESWIADYGADEAALLCASSNRSPKATLRVNKTRISPSELLARLRECGASADKNALFDDMIDVGAGIPIGKLYGYDEGLWFVEDAASRLAVAASGVAPGDTIVDVCAAPGGKSFSAALDMDCLGKIYSFDLHENKLGLVRRGAERLGIDIISAAARDGRSPDESLAGRADIVLCDVPCSGLGVIAKKPDIRYKDMDDIARLPDVQRAILSSSASYVKPGGVLLYSTCTLRRAENESVALDFIAKHADFRLEPFSAARIDADGGMLTLTPHKHGVDGFFIAKFRKNKDGN